MRKTKSNDAVWHRRRQLFSEWCAGVPVVELADRYKIHPDQVRQDVNATVNFLKDLDGLEKLGDNRARLLGRYWEELQLAIDNEAKALKGFTAEAPTKEGGIVKFKLVDPKAAAAYQGNRIKLMAQIQRLMGLEKAAPDPKSERTGQTWVEVLKLAHEKREADKKAAEAADGRSV